ncbi:site-2 protease family protein [Nitritalea halalkaliphila]|uniref:site-2 protease family protein n=1 Tax=Nitritalea halalkaliphila TaxID=590849 RepID=UPI0002EA02F6|nr:site-2 protease family protein [Nitritalea halalkaliphila]
MKGFIRSRRQFFDIGVAGPLAGFIVALALLVYGFLNLPEADYIYSIHPEYADPDYAGPDAESGMVAFELGYNALFWLLEKTLADPERMPEIGEVIHYPYLFAGYLALFFTALNLLPVGQLDGGHVIYGLFPKHHKEIALTAYTLFIAFAGLGLIHPQDTTSELLISIPLYVGFLYICYRKTPMQNQTRLALVLTLAAVQYLSLFFFPNLEGYAGWLFFAFILGRVLGIYHPKWWMGGRLTVNEKF